MRARTLLLLGAPLLTGCVDSLGIGSNCSVEMRAVRLQEGRAPDDTETVREATGDTRELWIYGRSRYTFRWGPSYERCQVEGPTRFSIGPGGARLPDSHAVKEAADGN